MKSNRLVLSLLPVAALAAIFFTNGASTPATAASAPGSGGLFTGSMGVKIFPSGSTVVDLATEGIYDPSTYGWAVVFDWTTINVDPGAVVTFTNHPSGAPVIWHATGNVLIEGEVNLRGASGHHYESGWSYAQPGPGGFRGGRGAASSYSSSAGFGPGGGYGHWSPYYRGGPGSFGTLGNNDPNSGEPGDTYGGSGVFPLIGGSGASGGWYSSSGGGGAGGGAILIASEQQVLLSSTARVDCDGGGGGYGYHSSGNIRDGSRGSGGAVRIVGDSVIIQGNARLVARGNQYGYGISGGYGRIRIEADSLADSNKLQVSGLIDPAAEISESTYEIIPQNEPTLQIIAMDPDGLAGPDGFTDISSLTSEPGAELFPPSAADVAVPQAGLIRLKILANHVNTGEIVIVRVSPARGQAVLYNSSPLIQTIGTQSEAEVEIDLTGGVSAIQLRVDYND